MASQVLMVIVMLLLTACGAAASAPSTAAGSTAASPASSPSTVAGSTAASPASSPSAAPGILQPSESFAVDEIAFSDGEQRIRMPVLVADDAELRSVGLMNRADLPDDAGMLFVFEGPVSGGFWMKNTLLPLTIAFVGQDGTVQQLIDMDPCTADPCPRYEPERPYRYAVEANRGFFATHDISPGWTLEVDDRLGGGR